MAQTKTNFNINDKFRISGIADCGTHCPRVHTTGIILELIGSKKARAILKNVEGETDVTAIIKLRDIKEPIKKEKKS